MIELIGASIYAFIIIDIIRRGEKALGGGINE